VPDQAALTCWRELLALPDLTIEEAGLSDYAMLSRIAFDNPLFLPLADPRYNDFTNIRFWKHRRMRCSHEHPWTVIARFDDQLPAFVEQRREAGVLWVLASGWQPSESQLALSNKFVPILARMLDPRGGRPVLEQSCTVGQSVPLPATQGLTSVTTPDGKIVAVDRDNLRFEETDKPGIYSVVQGDTRQTFAVNLDERESHTAPLDEAQLEERGVLMSESKTAAEIQAERRQMQSEELESRQKLWRWLIAGALVVLVAETLVAGRLARKAK
jgi:hypothetical protein